MLLLTNITSLIGERPQIDWWLFYIEFMKAALSIFAILVSCSILIFILAFYITSFVGLIEYIFKKYPRIFKLYERLWLDNDKDDDEL